MCQAFAKYDLCSCVLLSKKFNHNWCENVDSLKGGDKQKTTQHCC